VSLEFNIVNHNPPTVLKEQEEMSSLGSALAGVLKRKLRSDIDTEENRPQYRHCGREGSRDVIEIASAADQLHAAAVEYSIEDLPPEIMCLIFSFKYQPRLLLSRTAQNQDSIRTLFQSFGLVSSSLRRMCFDYLRKTPLFINVAHVNLEETAWLANHQAKIGSFRFSSETDLGIAKSLYLLTSCNVSDLEVLNIPAMVTPKQAPVDECDRAAAAGIPLYPGHLFDITEIHSKTVKALRGGRCFSIKSMELACYLTPWCDLLIKDYRGTLEELTLKITNLNFPPEQDPQMDSSMATSQLAIATKSIESMPCLKKLQLRTWFRADINIKSASLEEIDTYFMFDESYVRKCDCPALKIFKCRNFQQFYQCKNGVVPVKPFTEAELVLLRHDGGIDRWYERPSIDFRVGDRPFRGMKAPTECIVSIKC